MLGLHVVDCDFGGGALGAGGDKGVDSEEEVEEEDCSDLLLVYFSFRIDGRGRWEKGGKDVQHNHSRSIRSFCL